MAPRIPAGTDLGARPAPRPTRGVPGGRDVAAVGAGPRRAANAMSRNAGASSQLIEIGTDVAQAFFQAEERIRTRDDTVERARQINEYTRRVEEERLRIMTEGDFSNRETAAGYALFLRETAAELVTGHSGSQDSQAELAVRLDGIRTTYLTQAANDRLAASSVQVKQTMDANLNSLISQAVSTPGRLPELIIQADALIDDMSAALTPEQEFEYRMYARQQLVLSSVDTFLLEGDIGAARRFLIDTPGAENVLTPSQRREVMQRIREAESSQATMHHSLLPMTEARLQQEMLLAQMRGSLVNVNMGDNGAPVGNPPPGMAWARNDDFSVAMIPATDPEGNPVLKPDGSPAMTPLAVPIAGSALEGEQAEAAEAARQRAASLQARQRVTQDIVMDDINRSLEMVEGQSWYNPVTGLVGRGLAEVAGTDAFEVAKLIETVRANIGFDRLQQMREESKTGGALGQVTIGEIQRLEAVLGNLSQAQRKDTVIYNMRRLHDHYMAIIHGPIAAATIEDLAQLQLETNGFNDLTPEEQELVGQRLTILENREPLISEAASE